VRLVIARPLGAPTRLGLDQRKKRELVRALRDKDFSAGDRDKRFRARA
jgi:hypothetical protein